MWWSLMALTWLWSFSPLGLGAAPTNSIVLAASQAPLILAQRKPYDRGNCFQWIGCRGDSIGATWIDTPESCKTLGGKSWMDNQLKCHNLPTGMTSLF